MTGTLFGLALGAVLCFLAAGLFHRIGTYGERKKLVKFKKSEEEDSTFESDSERSDGDDL